MEGKATTSTPSTTATADTVLILEVTQDGKTYEVAVKRGDDPAKVTARCIKLNRLQVDARAEASLLAKVQTKLAGVFQKEVVALRGERDAVIAKYNDASVRHVSEMREVKKRLVQALGIIKDLQAQTASGTQQTTALAAAHAEALAVRDTEGANGFTWCTARESGYPHARAGNASPLFHVLRAPIPRETEYA